MHYSGLSNDDLANVTALNLTFLASLRSSARYSTMLDQAAPSLQGMCRALSDIQVRRLAATPFLLFSLRERDVDYWDGLFEARREQQTGDLFRSGQTRTGDEDRLVAAALGFLWTLANRNTYAARVISGATLSWCERLTEHTLVSLLAVAGFRTDLLIPRFSDREIVWTKLLGAGVSPERAVRRAAQLTVLQTMLTQDTSTGRERLGAAACRMRLPRAR